MAQQIKHGLIGMIVGLLISISAMALATGTYKQKVDTNCNINEQQRADLSRHDSALAGLSRDLQNNKEILLELKSGQREMFKKMDWR